MDGLGVRLQTLKRAVLSLHSSIDLYNEYVKKQDEYLTDHDRELYLAVRDSMIQRFEYTIDLFWKVIKIYLETVEEVVPLINSPRGIMREAMKIKLLSETEGNECMVMVESRNKTSHIYHQEVAEIIAHAIPGYYLLIITIIQKIESNI